MQLCMGKYRVSVQVCVVSSMNLCRCVHTCIVCEGEQHSSMQLCMGKYHATMYLCVWVGQSIVKRIQMSDISKQTHPSWR